MQIRSSRSPYDRDPQLLMSLSSEISSFQCHYHADPQYKSILFWKVFWKYYFILFFQNTHIRVFYFVFSNYSYQSILFCIFKILFRSILHITGNNWCEWKSRSDSSDRQICGDNLLTSLSRLAAAAWPQRLLGHMYGATYKCCAPYCVGIASEASSRWSAIQIHTFIFTFYSNMWITNIQYEVVVDVGGINRNAPQHHGLSPFARNCVKADTHYLCSRPVFDMIPYYMHSQSIFFYYYVKWQHTPII